MQSSKTYVRQDEHGVLQVGDTRVLLDSVVAASHLGHSAETIAQQYPALTFEDVYGAIAYYLANRTDVDASMERKMVSEVNCCVVVNRSDTDFFFALMLREAREFLTFCATVLAVGLAVVWYSAAGLAMLSGSPVVAGRFEAWGLPAWVGGALGAIEIVCALARFMPRANYFAALALIGMAVLQIAMTPRHGQPAWFELAGLLTLAFLVYPFRPGRMNTILAEDPDQLS